MKACRDTIRPLALVLAFVSCTVQTKVFTTNSSMEPTILQGEKFIAEMQSFRPKRGDLVIASHQEVLLVKRVIAIGGDVVEGHDSQVLVNDTEQHEPYIQHVGKPDGSMDKFGPTKVPTAKLFVMGDNRDYSFDSRDSRFGLVSVSDVKGRPTKVVVSPDPKRLNITLR
jgi:signal peptidase I